MKITLSGAHGAGKSSISKLLADKLGYQYIYTGGIMRQIAENQGVTLQELWRLMHEDPDLNNYITEILDNKQRDLGKKSDNIIVDGKLAWYFLPNSFKIFLDVDPDIATKRIFDSKRLNEDTHTNLAQTKKSIQERKDHELKNWVSKYGVDYFDKSNYDLVIDTTELSLNNTLNIILTHLKN